MHNNKYPVKAKQRNFLKNIRFGRRKPKWRARSPKPPARANPGASAARDILYFGPMGCCTGFYLLTRGMAHEEAIRLVRDSFAFLAAYEGPVPGASASECGNWKEHDLGGAKAEAAAFLPVLSDYRVDMLSYKN